MGGGLPSPDGGNAGYDPQRLLRPLLQRHGKEVRNTTKINKANMIESKILPYLGERKLAEIAPLDILSWQNAIQGERTSNGLRYRGSYLRSISNQLSAMLNHAVRYYNLPSNPMSKVDRMGSKRTEEMKFWTKDEYKAFSREIMDKDASFLLFSKTHTP